VDEALKYIISMGVVEPPVHLLPAAKTAREPAPVAKAAARNHHG
jgi:uncharacterized membrane protein